MLVLVLALFLLTGIFHEMNAKPGVKATLEYLWSTKMEKAKCWPNIELTRGKKKNNPCIILNGVLITAGK